jgi:hypothetical protein
VSVIRPRRFVMALLTDTAHAHPDPISPTDDDKPHSSNTPAAATETCTERLHSPSPTAPAESPSFHPSVRFPYPPSLDMIHSECDLMERVPICRNGDSHSHGHQPAPRARSKPYDYEWRCRYCDLKLPQRCRMKEHVRTHSTRLKQPCHTCGKRFTTNATLRRHMRQQHQSQARAPTAVHPTPSVATASDPAVHAVQPPTDAPSPASAPVLPPAGAPVPSSSPSSNSVSAPPPFIAFDVVDTVQVYPAPGSDLRRCNSIVHTAFLRRSDVYPHLAGQPIVYKTCNPALEST